jgi:hypothetical protein
MEESVLELNSRKRNGTFARGFPKGWADSHGLGREPLPNAPWRGLSRAIQVRPGTWVTVWPDDMGGRSRRLG